MEVAGWVRASALWQVAQVKVAAADGQTILRTRRERAHSILALIVGYVGQDSSPAAGVHVGLRVLENPRRTGVLPHA
jgi:hypothetical protein